MFAQDINTKSSCRFIDCDRKIAKENMAIDDALFSCFEADSEPVFRLYSWFSSFSVGVSQSLDDEREKIKMQNFTKRITGGGTLFHGHDISYSILIPSLFLKKYTVKESYEKICSFLLVFYKNIGLNAYFAKDDSSIALSKDSFCQNGFEPYDILVDGKKIGGNAQRRNKNVIFQHGSIALCEHNEIKENIGFNLEDFKITLSINEAKQILKDSFMKAFNTTLKISSISQKEDMIKQKLLKEKYDYR